MGHDAGRRRGSWAPLLALMGVIVSGVYLVSQLDLNGGGEDATATSTATNTATYTMEPGTHTNTHTPTEPLAPTETMMFTPSATGTSTPMPDRDGDGVVDELDRCPDKYGVSSNGGCPAGGGGGGWLPTKKPQPTGTPGGDDLFRNERNKRFE